MCTFLLLLFVSRLANGIVMGNRTSSEKADGIDMCPDEGYRPMSTKMINDLLKSGKVKRIAPTSGDEVKQDPSGSYLSPKKTVSFPDLPITKRENIFESVDINENVILTCTTDENVHLDQSTHNRNPFMAEAARVAVTDSHESRDLITNNVTSVVSQEAPAKHKVTINVEPIVTVFSPMEIIGESKSITNNSIGGKDEIKPSQHHSNLKKSHAINRQYSLIDIQTGLTKSEFTLDLEEKLRQSKRELGFDDRWNGWKEFSYRVETSRENGTRSRSTDKEMMVDNVVRHDEDGFSRNSKSSVEYCTHNCHISGLCNVGRPKVSLNSTDFLTTMNPDGVGSGDNVRNVYKTHSKKESCPCDLCTLAFLTDMNCHGGGIGCFKHRSRNSLSSPERGNKVFKEKIRITDSKFGRKSIEVSVRSPSSVTNGSSLKRGSTTSTDTKPDCTNFRIRNKFKENDLNGIREIYTNPNSTYNDVSIEQLPAQNFTQISRSPSPSIRPTVYSSESKKVNEKPINNGYRKISSSTVSGACTSTSSMSTILSYRRVRQLFQTIIEGRRVRRRPKADIMKFKEMEELGLGKFRNNRWYPSEYKTLSIWQDLNESAHGLQGEFKKYQKTK